VRKFRLISKSGDGIGLAWRLHQEGNEVDFWLKDPKGQHLYDGLLPRVKNWRDGLSPDTVLVFDMSGMGQEADEMRAKGYRVVGASKLADDLELDRTFGLAVADNHGIATPEWDEFRNFDSAIKYLADQEDAFVFKPNDNREGVRTFVSTSAEQMIAMLEHYKEIGGGKFTFVLQKIIQGVEISSEVWCLDGEIVPNSYNNTLEQKRLMNDDKGPNTGCMGSTVKFNMCPRLYDETFKKLEPWLRQVKYSGPLDINCIIAADGTPCMLEWTPRFGYSAIYAVCEGLGEPLGEFLFWMAGHEMPDFQPSTDWLGALRLTMPPYPVNEDAPECAGLPIIGLDLESEHVWPLDCMLNRQEKLVCSGFDAIVCELTNHDEYAEALWPMLYIEAAHLEIPEVQYRTDIRDDVLRRIEELDALGYLNAAEVMA
jgi:phosphoribosylamine--glycine ligase